MKSEFENKISVLHGDGKWREIVALGEQDENPEAYRLSWVWPTFDDLSWIKKLVADYSIPGILSVGCGTGLLEWLIYQHSHCPIVGLELDSSWWTSKYSPPRYLDKITFIDRTKTFTNIPENYGLMFCYFNNGQAFENYLQAYGGKILIIIGPIEGQNRCTDPLPFDDKLFNSNWVLNRSRKLDNKRDCIAVYLKIPE